MSLNLPVIRLWPHALPDHRLRPPSRPGPPVSSLPEVNLNPSCPFPQGPQLYPCCEDGTLTSTPQTQPAEEVLPGGGRQASGKGLFSFLDGGAHKSYMLLARWEYGPSHTHVFTNTPECVPCTGHEGFLHRGQRSSPCRAHGLRALALLPCAYPAAS